MYHRFSVVALCAALLGLGHCAQSAPPKASSKTTKTSTTKTKPVGGKAKTTAKPTAKKTPSGAFRTVSNHKIFGTPHTGQRYAVHHATKPFEVASLQRFNKLENGLYTLRAWVKSSGGLVSTMSASGFDDAKSRKSVSIPQTSDWKQIEIKDIKVTNGKCTIAFQSKSPGHKWMAFDDVEFFRQLPQETSSEKPKGNVYLSTRKNRAMQNFASPC